MKHDQELRKKKKHSKKETEVDMLLKEIGLEQICKNFKDRGCFYVADLKGENHNNLQNYFLITEYGKRKTILSAVQKYLAAGKKSFKTYESKESKESNEQDDRRVIHFNKYGLRR
eukprot:337267_1